MAEVWLYTFLSILIVSSIALVGILFLIVKKKFFDKIQNLLVSFAVGSLLGGAILHLIPESLHQDHEGVSPALVIVSILFFFILEKFITGWNHHHAPKKAIKSFGPLNLIADSFHNFLDGILIAAAYIVDIQTGIIATFAVVAHELPQEIGDFAILVQAGYSKKRALFFNLMSALSSFVGAALVLLFPVLKEEFTPYILPLAAGGFIYIALADLMPELKNTKSAKQSFGQVVALIIGLLIMWLL